MVPLAFFSHSVLPLQGWQKGGAGKVVRLGNKYQRQLPSAVPTRYGCSTFIPGGVTMVFSLLRSPVSCRQPGTGWDYRIEYYHAGRPIISGEFGILSASYLRQRPLLVRANSTVKYSMSSSQ
jgi:hypothetical protein